MVCWLTSGSRSRSRLPSPQDLAAALTGRADPASAESRLRECWEVLKVRLWAGDWLTAEVASRYGDCLRRQGKLSEAEPILITAAMVIVVVSLAAFGPNVRGPPLDA